VEIWKPRTKKADSYFRANIMGGLPLVNSLLPLLLLCRPGRRRRLINDLFHLSIQWNISGSIFTLNPENHAWAALSSFGGIVLSLLLLPSDANGTLALWQRILAAAVFHLILRILVLGCPKSFSKGEAILNASSICVAFLLGSSMSVCNGGIFTPITHSSFYPYCFELRRVSEISSIAIVGLPLGLLVAFTIRLTSTTGASSSKMFFLLHNLFSLIIVMVAYWALRVGALSGRKDPITVVGNYLVAERVRVKLCVGWILCIIGAVTFAPFPDKSVPKTVARKWYHILCLLLFYPAVMCEENEFMGLAFAVAFAIFAIIESFRLSNPQLSKPLTDFMDKYREEHDKGAIFLTHTYLLLGCALPLWLYQAGWQIKGSTVTPLSGVLLLGVGDTAASVGGKALGKKRWSKSSKKTVEGTICAMVTTVICLLVFGLGLHPLTFSLADLIGLMAGCLLEGFVDQVDNLILPWIPPIVSLSVQTLLESLGLVKDDPGIPMPF